MKVINVLFIISLLCVIILYGISNLFVKPLFFDEDELLETDYNVETNFELDYKKRVDVFKETYIKSDDGQYPDSQIVAFAINDDGSYAICYKILFRNNLNVISIFDSDGEYIKGYSLYFQNPIAMEWCGSYINLVQRKSVGYMLSINIDDDTCAAFTVVDSADNVSLWNKIKSENSEITVNEKNYKLSSGNDLFDRFRKNYSVFSITESDGTEHIVHNSFDDFLIVFSAFSAWLIIGIAYQLISFKDVDLLKRISG